MEKLQQAKLKAQSNLFSLIIPCKIRFQKNQFLIDLNDESSTKFETHHYLRYFLTTKNHSLQFHSSNEVFNLTGKIQINQDDLHHSSVHFIADTSEDFENYRGTIHEQS